MLTIIALTWLDNFNVNNLNGSTPSGRSEALTIP